MKKKKKKKKEKKKQKKKKKKKKEEEEEEEKEKEKEEKKTKRFVLTKTMSFRFMSVQLIGWNKRRFCSITESAFGTKFIPTTKPKLVGKRSMAVQFGSVSRR
jgi:uncharacterized membrane protein YdbT with pleckstrin-like domain